MFRIAKPIYPIGKSRELNTYAVFRTQVGCVTDAVLHITAFSFYRVTVNGRFLGFGPARTAEGYARVDELPLGELLTEEQNEVKIEVSGYYCRSLSTVKQPSFLQAEILGGGEVIAATGRDFYCQMPKTRLQRVERYSVQRHFSEVWDLRAAADTETVETEVITPAPELLSRVAPMPFYEDIKVSAAASVGALEPDAELPVQRDFYSFPCLPDFWGGFTREEIAYHPYEWIQGFRQVKAAGRTELPLTLSAGEYAILDLTRIETGFFMLSATAARESDLVLAFSEDASGEHFAFTDMHSHNALELLLPAGKQSDCMSFEPYVLRYAILAVKSGEVILRSFGVKSFVRNVQSVPSLSTGDPVLDEICASAVRTYSHNAVDIYMDCPSRERAGWLCDSYFTAQSEFAMLGSTDTEAAFLQNYILYRDNGEIPAGVLPMCYPGDTQIDGKFIPQWTMWYILEVEQYLNVRRPDADRELFRPSIERLLDFYRAYENSDGLLEKLPSWSFVEWSIANQWTQDVSYPTNLLYAQVLECVDRIYGDDFCRRRAGEIRQRVLEQAFNGEIFCDHAVRNEAGELIRETDASEACQYYAMLFGGYDWKAPMFDGLRELVLHVFGSKREGRREDIAEVNAFIGAYLRLEALQRIGEYELLLNDIKFFFGGMSQETATLWEYRQRHGSRDHGFASYAYVAVKEALKHLM